jgi:hypothetical protein
MGEQEDIETVRRARAVAGALVEGNVDALGELSDLLRTAGTSDKIAEFVVQLIFELLPPKAREWMAAKAEEEGHSNVIDFFTQRPRK